MEEKICTEKIVVRDAINGTLFFSGVTMEEGSGMWNKLEEVTKDHVARHHPCFSSYEPAAKVFALVLGLSISLRGFEFMPYSIEEGMKKNYVAFTADMHDACIREFGKLKSDIPLESFFTWFRTYLIRDETILFKR